MNISASLNDRNEWPLDSMCLQCDVTKKNREDFSVAPREGAYIHGLYMEGAHWDTQVLIQSLISVCFLSVSFLNTSAMELWFFKWPLKGLR